MRKASDVDQQEVARRLLTRWHDDPICLANDVFGLQIWEAPPPGQRHGSHGQADIARAVTRNRWVSCRSGQKTGKSTIAALLGWWWVLTRPNARVLFTAPTFSQVERVLWREFRRIHSLARFELGGQLNETAHAGFKFGDGREVFGRTVATVDAMQGLSGANQFVVVDEASGYKESTLEAIFGNMSGGGVVLLLGNPVRPSGTFYASQTSKRDVWCSLHISSLDTPNHTGFGEPIPGLSDPAFLEFAKGIWGPGSPAWDTRIDGNFPSGAIDTLISLALIESARNRYDDVPADGPLSAGIDCAGFGDDDSAMAFRRGKKVFGVKTEHGVDGPELAARFIHELSKHRRGPERVRVKVDHVGEGASCFDSLLRVADAQNLELFGVNNGSSPTSQPPNGAGYANLGTQLYVGARDFLKEGGAIPDPVAEPEQARALARLEGDLAGRRYSFDAQGRYQLEKKADFKARLGRSPDIGDCITLAIYEPPPLASVRVRGQRKMALGLGGF